MSEEEWIQELQIPASALPGLRDLRIQFTAVLEFDMILGPVAYIHEISRGSSYIKKLKDFQTLSEVYAGVARSPQHTLSTLEEDIAVFRYDPEGKTDITTVFFISCIPNSDLRPIRELGQKAMFRAKGNPNTIGSELGNVLKEKFAVEKMFTSDGENTQIFILDEDRITDPLGYDLIQGVLIIDVGSKMADFRNLPRSIGIEELDAKILLNYFDNQLRAMGSDSCTSFIFRGIPFIGTKVKKQDIYYFVMLKSNMLEDLMVASEWLIAISDNIGKEWKQASQNELTNAFSIFKEIKYRNPPIERISNYVKILLRAERIKPLISRREEFGLTSPVHIEDKLWSDMANLDGSLNLHQVSENWDEQLINVITSLEWAKTRNLVEFITD